MGRTEDFEKPPESLTNQTSNIHPEASSPDTQMKAQEQKQLTESTKSAGLPDCSLSTTTAEANTSTDSVTDGIIHSNLDNTTKTAMIISNGVTNWASNFITAGFNAAKHDAQWAATGLKSIAVNALHDAGATKDQTAIAGNVIDTAAGAVSMTIGLGHGLNKFAIGLTRDISGALIKASGEVTGDNANNPKKNGLAVISLPGAIIGRAISDTVTDIGTGLGKEGPVMLDAAGKAMHKAGDFISNASHDPQRAASDMVKGIKDGVTAAVTDTKSVDHGGDTGAWIGEHVVPVVTAAAEVPGMIKGVKSMIDGAKAAKAAAGAAITDAEAGASAAAKAAGKAESPGVKASETPEGGATASTADGGKVTQNADGSRVEIKDGAKTTTYPDGSMKVEAPGRTAFKDKDGNITQEWKDGSSSIKKADGTEYTMDKAGNKTTIHPDGTEIEELVNGTKTIKSPDGKVSEIAKDGTTTTTYPDGQIVIETPKSQTSDTPDWLKASDTAAPKVVDTKPSNQAPDWGKPADAKPTSPPADLTKTKTPDAQPTNKAPDWDNLKPADTKPTSQPAADKTADWLKPKSADAKPSSQPADLPKTKPVDAQPTNKAPDWDSLKPADAKPTSKPGDLAKTNTSDAQPAADKTADWLKPKSADAKPASQPADLAKTKAADSPPVKSDSNIQKPAPEAKPEPSAKSPEHGKPGTDGIPSNYPKMGEQIEYPPASSAMGNDGGSLLKGTVTGYTEPDFLGQISIKITRADGTADAITPANWSKADKLRRAKGQGTGAQPTTPEPKVEKPQVPDSKGDAAKKKPTADEPKQEDKQYDASPQGDYGGYQGRY